jgi:type II secretory pathway pseudopilin PulG
MPNPRRLQRGVTLLLLLFLTLGIGATIFLSGWNGSYWREEREKKTQLALQQAKDALIGYAAAYLTLPGRLPCPERLSAGSTIEGQAQGTCITQATRIGRLPWKSLGLDRLTDGTGEPLWYAVSPNFSAKVININTVGQLQLDGANNAAVAIIFAPGPPLAGQTRSIVTPATPPQEADYLDLGNAGGSAFVSNGPSTTFNDRIITITQAELFKVVNKRILGQIRGALSANGLLQYYNDNGHTFPPTGTNLGTLPFDSQTMKWLSDNSWFALATYIYAPPAAPQLSIGSEKIEVTP